MKGKSCRLHASPGWRRKSGTEAGMSIDFVRVRRTGALLIGVLATMAASQIAFAQTFGVELHNTLMPAAGAMGGASLSRPQDLTSALNGNPATLSNFHGGWTSFG